MNTVERMWMLYKSYCLQLHCSDRNEIPQCEPQKLNILFMLRQKPNVVDTKRKQCLRNICYNLFILHLISLKCSGICFPPFSICINSSCSSLFFPSLSIPCFNSFDLKINYER